MSYQQMLSKVLTQDGFLAALDQSGGSTPKALKLYGVPESAYSGEEQMNAKVHEMRTRIITTPAFNGDRILGAILFEETMNRQVRGKGTAQYLWQEKRVVPFLKVDKGLADEQDGVQRYVDAYPAQKAVEVLYDPSDPAVAYLEVHRSIGAIILLAFGGLWLSLAALLVALQLLSS